MDSYPVIETSRFPEGDSRGGNRKRKQATADMDPPVAISSDDFCTTTTTTTFPFPFLAVMPGRRDPVDVLHGGLDPYAAYELSFIDSSKDMIKHKMPMPRKGINHHFWLLSYNGGWIMFVHHIGMVIIFNPITKEEGVVLPSIYKYLHNIDYFYLLADPLANTFVVFAFHRPHEDRFVVATATPGDDEWSVTDLPPSLNKIKDIIFHKADGKFYAMDSRGVLLVFGLTRTSSSSSKTTAICDQSFLAKEMEIHLHMYGYPHLVSDGTYLLQVKEVYFEPCNIFQILRYRPDADKWIEMKTPDLGNNSIFIDYYGAKLLPCCPGPPQQQEEGGRRLMTRNCIYFIQYKELPPFPDEEAEEAARARFEEEQESWRQDDPDNYIHRHFEDYSRETLYNPQVSIYDLTKGTVEPCFSTDIQAYFSGYEPALMWFTPSSFNN